MKKLLLGNHAVARGAYEAGVRVVSSYPGTPSTEITEEMARYPKEEVYAEWAPNEKVACEVAIGASIGGVSASAAVLPRVSPFLFRDFGRGSFAVFFRPRGGCRRCAVEQHQHRHRLFLVRRLDADLQSLSKTAWTKIENIK